MSTLILYRITYWLISQSGRAPQNALLIRNRVRKHSVGYIISSRTSRLGCVVMVTAFYKHSKKSKKFDWQINLLWLLWLSTDQNCIQKLTLPCFKVDVKYTVRMYLDKVIVRAHESTNKQTYISTYMHTFV